MNPERWEQVEQLYHSALERDVSQRAAFLNAACAGDDSLRREIESLLAHQTEAENLLESPAMEIAAKVYADDQADSLVGQSLGSYQILSLLGVGGMGEVYRARDTRLDRTVALKILPSEVAADEERMRRFVREAKAASAINHPNVAAIYEIGEAEGVSFIAMEFVEGQTLAAQIHSRPLEVAKLVEIGLQVADALDGAHSKGITHRDLKPANLMVTPRGQVKVLDFGLAKIDRPAGQAVESNLSTLMQTTPGAVLGTVPYMSPEQARGQEVDGRSDIFSLGVVLYEMATGKRPFDGATLTDVLAAILKAEPLPLTHYSPELPVELQRIVSRALRKDREERYQVIKDLLIDLKDLKRELDLQAKTKSAGRTINDLMQVGTTRTDQMGIARTTSSVEPLESEIKRHKWGAGLRPKTLVIAVAVITLFSLISFCAGIKQIPSSAQPSFRQLTFRRGTISTARFAPDGQTFIYSAAFDGKPVELFTSRIERPESSSLKLQAGIQSISSAGEMAILLGCDLDWGECRDGTLAQLPPLGGTPREIMEHVYEADWAPDGKRLAIIRVVEGEYQLEYPAGTVLYKSEGQISNVRVSPRGDLVAFIDHPVLGNPSGFVMVVNPAGEKRVLSTGWETAKGLAWSPTGDEVWFSASKTRELALYAVTLSGRERLVFQAPGDLHLYDISRDGRVLAAVGNPRSRMIGFTAGSEKERDLSWFDWSTSADLSADGRMLLFYEWGMAVGGVPIVYLRKMDEANDPIRLGQGKALALSPDRKWALALQEGLPPQLVLLPTGPGEPRLLPRGAIKEYHYASWFPDGEQILFTGLESGHGLRSYVQDKSGGQAHTITDEGMIALSVSPDGKRLFAWAPDKGLGGKYYMCPLNGTNPTPIPSLEAGEEPIQWTADGRALYVRGSGDTAKIYRVNLPSGRRELWKELMPDPVGLIGIEVKPGGIRITPDGKSYVYTYWSALQDLFLVEGLK